MFADQYPELNSQEYIHYTCIEENSKGSIEVGKLADLVILSADPTVVDPETIDQIKVVETVKEGKSIYVATNAADAAKEGNISRGCAES